MLGSTHIVRINQTAATLSGVEIARRRLARALEARQIADRAEEAAETSVLRHGGPGYCSDAVIGNLMRAHARVFVCGVEVSRWERRLTEAMIDQHTNGGQQ
jgi:hypothetical protein